MNRFGLLAMLFGAVVFAVGCGQPAPEPAAATKGPDLDEPVVEKTVVEETGEGGTPGSVGRDAAQSQQEEQYVPVSAREIGVAMVLKGTVLWGRDEKPSFDGPGSIKSFSCWGHEIELVSDQFEDGFICTKQYGKIKIKPNPDFTFRMEMKPSQKAALMKLKDKGQ